MAPWRPDPRRADFAQPSCNPFIWHTHVFDHGSLAALADEFGRFGVIATILRVWGPVFFGSRVAWTMIGMYATLELTLMKLLPGHTIHGPITEGGNIPIYKANGIPQPRRESIKACVPG